MRDDGTASSLTRKGESRIFQIRKREFLSPNGLVLDEPTTVVQKLLMEISVKSGSAYDPYVFMMK